MTVRSAIPFSGHYIESFSFGCFAPLNNSFNSIQWATWKDSNRESSHLIRVNFCWQYLWPRNVPHISWSCLIQTNMNSFSIFSLRFHGDGRFWLVIFRSTSPKIQEWTWAFSFNILPIFFKQHSIHTYAHNSTFVENNFATHVATKCWPSYYGLHERCISVVKRTRCQGKINFYRFQGKET